MVAFFTTTIIIIITIINNQRLGFQIRSVPGTIVSANLQGSTILKLSLQEHAKLIPLKAGDENLKSNFPGLLSESEIFSLNYTVQYGKKTVC